MPLLNLSDGNSQHDIQFINTFWDPLDNPFNKHARPAKLFLFFEDQSSDLLY